MKERQRKDQREPYLRGLLKECFISPRSIYIFAAILALTVFVSPFLARWNPRCVNVVSRVLLESAYTTMWQVQAGITAAAIPILVFIIELARDERQAAMRTHEVLIHDTDIWPLFFFALVGTAKIGADIMLAPTGPLFIIDLVLVLLATMTLTGRAYYRAIRLLLSPVKLRAKAMEIAKRKMAASIDSSIAVRVGSHLLFAAAERLNVGYRPFMPEPHTRADFVVLRAPRTGLLRDVHLGKFSQFIAALPRKTSEKVVGTPTPAPTPTADPNFLWRRPQKDIWLMKRYMSPFSGTDDGFLLLRQNAFEPLDACMLERQLKAIIRVSHPDED
jgi:hypothetical protein